MVFLRELSLHSTLQHFFALLDYVAQSSVFLDDRDKCTSLESGTSSRALKPAARSRTNRRDFHGGVQPRVSGGGATPGRAAPKGRAMYRVGHIQGRALSKKSHMQGLC